MSQTFNPHRGARNYDTQDDDAEQPTSRVLLISVRLHEGRYHGVDDSCVPSPGRLFQALVAAAGISGPLSDQEKRAFRWLEELDPPLVASAVMKPGQQFTNYMPNNDLDAMRGDRRRIGEIRVGKNIQPMLFDAEVPFLYAWTFEASERGQCHATVISDLSEQLYQFGRGWDMAWAWSEELTEAELEDRLMEYPGVVHRPSGGGVGKNLRCPGPGTLNSLMRRYEAGAKRFQTESSGRRVTQSRSRQPEPRFRQVAYESPPERYLYELREHDVVAAFSPWPLDRVTALVEALRDEAKRRLQEALPGKSQDVERVLVGRKPNGDDAVPTSLRVRIMPLPSIGHHHADRSIRRVLVEVPAGCPLRADDINWAFAGQELNHPVYSKSIYMTPTEAHDMLKHYGVDKQHRVWRSVTPVALPESAARRRIPPTHTIEQAKGGTERRTEQERAAAAVFHALRHVQVRHRPDHIRVQREPFETNGQRVEEFANGTRFAKERLWHVEIGLEKPVQGPLVIGDGRFLGLGLTAPVRHAQEGPHRNP